ncbi:unnamed protein product [Rangifer tarandus platyrhynchus]|uniref:Uncharacterized protein n=1 Tax=Rangifer tarandus platyrhynchus TaxID=3082113 RepID=A0ABN9A4X3_RANTA|nr:unnamed protein product [Rangifer tarandus platyrhynchus]
MHHGEPSSGDLNIRGLQDPGNSEPMALNWAEVMPRGPDPSGDQEPTDHSPRVERRQQPPGTQGCLQPPCSTWLTSSRSFEVSVTHTIPLPTVLAVEQGCGLALS